MVKFVPSFTCRLIYVTLQLARVTEHSTDHDYISKVKYFLVLHHSYTYLICSNLLSNLIIHLSLSVFGLTIV